MTERDGPGLSMRGIGKRFGATVALDDVSLEVGEGEVHALIGENGAGKSTLVKILSGALRPDAGSVTVGGRPLRPAGPLAAREHGVAMIYQELNLAPDLTIEENLILGLEESRLGIIDRRALRDRVIGALDRVGGSSDLQPDALVRNLPPAARQLVEIARALVVDARIVVMDEPTSSLGEDDIDRLFDVIRRLKGDGVSVIYISHFLEEVQEVGDRFTVLRDGRVAGTGALAETTLDSLVELMIGRRLAEMYPRVPHTIGDTALEVCELSGHRLPNGASLRVRRGEIVGIAGLVGSGRTEFFRTVFGLRPVTEGRITVAGVPTPRRPSPHDSLSRGLGMLSEDRAGEGLAMDRDLTDNLLLSKLSPFSRAGWLKTSSMSDAARALMTRLDIRARDPGQTVGDLSGGNQQKVAIGRLLHHDVDVLLLDEPTRGIDVGSKAQIYRLIGELAAQGKAVCLVSSYLPELLGICDSVAVMRRGRLGTPRPAHELDEHELASLVARDEGTGP